MANYQILSWEVANKTSTKNKTKSTNLITTENCYCFWAYSFLATALMFAGCACRQKNLAWEYIWLFLKWAFLKGCLWMILLSLLLVLYRFMNFYDSFSSIGCSTVDQCAIMDCISARDDAVTQNCLFLVLPVDVKNEQSAYRCSF